MFIHRQTAVTLGIWATTSAFMLVVQVWLQSLPDYTGPTAIWDLGFALIPHILPHWVPDLWVGGLFLTAILLLGCMPVRRVKYKEKIVRRFFFLWAIIYMLRGLSLMWTRYPRVAPEGALYFEGIGVGIWGVLSGAHPTQVDFMFSGHTATMLLLALTVNYYTPFRTWSWVFDAMTVLGWMTIIASRIHYSADVVLAVVIVCFLVGFVYLMLSGNNWFPSLVLATLRPKTFVLPLTIYDANDQKIVTNGNHVINTGENISPAWHRVYRWLIWIWMDK
jgi:hypothetical protein